MSLTSLTEDSITTILGCLGTRTSTVAPLRRTCWKTDNVARRGNFDKVQAVAVFLHNSTGYQGDPIEYTLHAEISRKSTKDEKDFLVEKNKNKPIHKDAPYLISSASTYTQELTRMVTYPRILKDAFRLFAQLMKMVKSVDALQFKNLTIDTAFLEMLTKWPSQLSMLKKISVTGAQIDLNAEEMTKLLQIGQLDSIEFNCSIQRPLLFGDSHLISMENIAIDRNQYHNVIICPGVTDETIRHWMNHVPRQILMPTVKTAFTLKLLWELIMVMTEKRQSSAEAKCFAFGYLDRTEEDVAFLMEIQKINGYKWKIHRDEDAVEAMYKVSHYNGHNVKTKFRFSI